MGDCIFDDNVHTVTAMFTASSGNKLDSVRFNLYLDQQSAFGNVILWGHPAWLNTKEKSIQIKAATEWVYHNRIWMAIDRTTMAEIVGSVKGVIPSSKLASYGDFRYDLDIETMYDNLEEIESKIPDENERVGGDVLCQLDDSSCLPRDGEFAAAKEIESLPSCDCPSFSYLRELVNQMKTENNNYARSQSPIDQWLSKWKEFLNCVRLSVAEDDPWTDTLLKVCCRFLTTARDNPSLMLLMEEEMPLITDYRQLYTDPIPMIELLSLPQPRLEENRDSSATQTDVLWLQLSSSGVRKLWSRNTATENIFSNRVRPFSGFSDASIGATNFLRRRQAKIAENVYDQVEVPEDEAKRLLGSLINIIDGFNSEMEIPETSVNKFTTTEDTSSKSNFPEAHGEWTKSLFPHGKDIVNSSVNNSVGKIEAKIEATQQTLCPATPIKSVPSNNLSVSPSNLYGPTSNLPVPPSNLPVQQPKLTLPTSNLTVPPPKLSAQTSAVFQPSNFISGTVPPPPQGPVYYMPVAHYVNRESKYYNKFRRRLPQKKSNHLGMTQKASDKPFMLSNIPQHCPFEHWLLMRSYTFQTAPSMPNQRQICCHGNFQQSMIPMAHIQPPQIPRHIPVKLDKNNSIQTEYFFKEMNKNRILQNISNIIPNAKPRTESIPGQPLQLYYQSMEYFIQPVAKQNTSVNSSTVPNLNYSMHRKLLKQYFAEEQSTYPNSKVNKDFAIASVQKSTANPVCQREILLPQKLEFENAKTPDYLQSSNGNKLKSAIMTNSKGSSSELKQRSGKVQSIYFTQKWFSDNRNVYKTKFCNIVSNNELSTANSIKGKYKSRDLKKRVEGLRTQIFRKQKLFPTLLLHTCKSKTHIRKCPSFKGFKFFNRFHSYHLLKRNTLKQHKGLLKNLDYSDGTFFAKGSAHHSNEKGKCVRPITVEYLKDVVDHLLCDECDGNTLLNSDNGKIDGFTHFKMAVLEILRRTLLMLNDKSS